MMLLSDEMVCSRSGHSGGRSKRGREDPRTLLCGGESYPFQIAKKKIHTIDICAGSENGGCSPRCHETSLALEIIAESGAAVGEPGSVRLCPLLKIARKLLFIF